MCRMSTILGGLIRSNSVSVVCAGHDVAARWWNNWKEMIHRRRLVCAACLTVGSRYSVFAVCVIVRNLRFFSPGRFEQLVCFYNGFFPRRLFLNTVKNQTRMTFQREYYVFCRTLYPFREIHYFSFLGKTF